MCNSQPNKPILVSQDLAQMSPPFFLFYVGNHQSFYVPEEAVWGLVSLLSRIPGFLRARAKSLPSVSAEMEMNVAFKSVY